MIITSGVLKVKVLAWAYTVRSFGYFRTHEIRRGLISQNSHKMLLHEIKNSAKIYQLNFGSFPNSVELLGFCGFGFGYFRVD